MADIDKKSDLLVGVMNLIEMENHAHFSFLMTKDVKWVKLKDEIRKMRTKYMKEIEKEEDSQLHCFNKHTLSAMFRLIEVGDKCLSEGQEQLAINYYNDSYNLLEMFYNLNLNEQKGPEKKVITNKSFFTQLFK